MAENPCLAQLLLDHAPACTWIAAPSGVFLRVFRDSTAVFGKTAGELTGRTLSEALEPQAANIWTARFALAFAGQTQTLRERRGDTIWYVSIFPITVDGRIQYAGGIAREITPWAVAERELRNTVVGALKAQESDRTKGSRFLHDVVAQNLTALGLQLDLLRMDLAPIEPEACRRIGQLQEMLEGIMQQVRDYSYQLNPSTVHRAGLRAALHQLAERMRHRFPGALRIHVDPSLTFEPKLAGALYHIAQEAVENAVQHAGCTAIDIAVTSTPGGARLQVRDNGTGFDPSGLSRGYRGLGLLSMEHYAAEAGLELSIGSHRETGTVIRASLPGIEKSI